MIEIKLALSYLEQVVNDSQNIERDYGWTYVEKMRQALSRSSKVLHRVVEVLQSEVMQSNANEIATLKRQVQELQESLNKCKESKELQQ